MNCWETLNVKKTIFNCGENSFKDTLLIRLIGNYDPRGITMKNNNLPQSIWLLSVNDSCSLTPYYRPDKIKIRFLKETLKVFFSPRQLFNSQWEFQVPGVFQLSQYRLITLWRETQTSAKLFPIDIPYTPTPVALQFLGGCAMLLTIRRHIEKSVAYGSYLSSSGGVELSQMFWQSNLLKGGVCYLTDDPVVHTSQRLQ